MNRYIEDDDDFVTCISSNFKKEKLLLQLNPHFILCDKNNIILQKSIERYIKAFKNNTPYGYWRWSICNLLTIEGITEKKSQILYLNDKKFKFILERNFSCGEYNGEVVFKNRYNNYRNHNFIE